MLCKYIAHACGGINNITYSNSLEAIQKSYHSGHRFIEIDISKTNDNRFILLHDWYGTRNKLFGKKGIVSEKHFLNAKMINNLTQMNLDMVLSWLQNHQDLFLVTDVKNTQITEVLKYVNKFYPDLRLRIIPQIYSFSEYQEVYKLGYENIILALYKLKNTQTEIVNFIASHKLMAVSLSKKRAKDKLGFKIKKLGVEPIVHTVNDKEEKAIYNKLGIDVFFTDFLV